MKTSNSSTVDGPIYRSPQWPPHHWPNLKGHTHITHSPRRIACMTRFGNAATNWKTVNTAAWDAWITGNVITTILGQHTPTAGYRAFTHFAANYYQINAAWPITPPGSTAITNPWMPDQARVTSDGQIYLHWPIEPPDSGESVWTMGFAIGPTFARGSWPPTIETPGLIAVNAGPNSWVGYGSLADLTTLTGTLLVRLAATVNDVQQMPVTILSVVPGPTPA